jgi:hypothetical protein
LYFPTGVANLHGTEIGGMTTAAKFSIKRAYLHDILSIGGASKVFE